jgi:hypothetical protein
MFHKATKNTVMDDAQAKQPKEATAPEASETSDLLRAQKQAQSTNEVAEPTKTERMFTDFKDPGLARTALIFISTSVVIGGIIVSVGAIEEGMAFLVMAAVVSICSYGINAFQKNDKFGTTESNSKDAPV